MRRGALGVPRKASRPGGMRVSASASSLVVTLAGCTLQLSESEPCRDDTQCQRAFGSGSRCGDDGLCTEPTLPARCGRSTPADLVDNPSKYADRIIVGSLFSFADQVNTLQAAELAIRQVNDLGGLDDTRFAMLHCDYTPEAGDQLDDIQASRMLAEFLVEDLGVPLIVGPRGSSRAEAVYNTVTDQAIVISPSATSSQLTGIDVDVASDETPGTLWRTVPPDDLQGDVLADDVLSRGRRSTAIIFQRGPYGEGLSQQFATQFSQGEGQVASFGFSGSDFATTIATIADGIDSGKFDEVLFISSDLADYEGFLRGATATRQLREAFLSLGDRETGGLLFSDTAYDEQLFMATQDEAAELFPLIRGTRPFPASGRVFNAFAAAYDATYNIDAVESAFTAHSYDAAWLGLYGIAWAQLQEQTLDAQAIARGLRRLSAPLDVVGDPVDILPERWVDVVETFRQGRPINVQGASGNLEFDSVTEETTASIEVWRVVEGDGWDFQQLTIVEPTTDS